MLQRGFISLAAAALGGALVGSVSCTALPDNVDATRAVDRPDLGRSILGMRWMFHAADPKRDPHPQELAGAATDDRRIFLGSDDGDFYALDADSGEVLWEREIGAVSTRPVVERNRLYVATKRGELLCLDALGGDEIWRHRTGSPFLEPPVLGDERVYAASEGDEVFALDRQSGEVEWRYEDEREAELSLHGHAGVTLDGDELFTGFSSGALVSLDIESGEPRWSANLASGLARFGDIHTTPEVRRGRVYAGSVGAGVFAVDRDDGEVLWRLPITGAGGLRAEGEALYVAAADEGIFAVDRAGHVIWRQGTEGAGVGGRPSVVDDYLILTLSEAGLYILDRHSGEVHQFFDPGFGISAEPTVEQDQLYVMSNNAILYAMRLNL